MVYVSSIICGVLTFGMALLQLALSFGAPLGEYALGGQNKVLPKKMRITSCIFAILFTFIGIAYLSLGNIIHIGLNDTFTKILIIIQTLFLAFAIYSNGFLTKSKKEKYVMTPLSLVTFIFSVILLLLT